MTDISKIVNSRKEFNSIIMNSLTQGSEVYYLGEDIVKIYTFKINGIKLILCLFIPFYIIYALIKVLTRTCSVLQLQREEESE